MNRLTREERARILHLLCEGNSIRATVRLTGASKNTITKLLIDAGRACAAYQDRVLRNLPCKRIQVDEIWSFVYAKREHVRFTKAAPVDAGPKSFFASVVSSGARSITEGSSFSR